MSIYVSSEQLWDKVYEDLNYSSIKKEKICLEYKEDYGKLLLNHYNTGSGIKYSYFIASFQEDTILENTNSYNSSFLCFNTGENIYMEDTRKKEKVKFDSDVCWNGQMYEGHLSNSLYLKNQKSIMHTITFDNNLFKELVKNNEKFKEAKSVYKGDYIDVNFNNIVANKQKMLLNDLLNIPFVDDKLQMLYLESKIFDLIYTSLNSIENPHEKESIYLNMQDIESLQKAKKILIENMTTPPSLKELAHKCAINEFKLKKGFKQLFGNTVFGFLQEYRLNKAKKLLETNDINIGEATILVGYKSISHFSKIFKEHFGITPIEIKKESRKYYY